MEKEKKVIEENVSAEEVTAVEEESLVVKFKKPYTFEGKEYTEVDLTALEDITAADMIATNKYMERSSAGTINVMPEISLEYACVLAAKAVKLPIEFFTNLPPKEALKVKNRVMGFLFGQD